MIVLEEVSNIVLYAQQGVQNALLFLLSIIPTKT